MQPAVIVCVGAGFYAIQNGIKHGGKAVLRQSWKLCSELGGKLLILAFDVLHYVRKRRERSVCIRKPAFRVC